MTTRPWKAVLREEAALAPLCQADTVIGRDGNRLDGVPIERAREPMQL
jgi:hypothetical protein